jgi:preprotein translocase subunit SecG|uniref:Preprotein translocase SecG subunit n=1 Tax=Pseudo-nitzschia cuspidata TaxID=237455 RepID=UPI001D0F9E05|nr:Preprotein translocase SecG subunit [Pseudo-nitzschia cuspidata]UBA15490.1 Preprotein translocase SecG subunit [Pseudo-nitzschia cuspidata]
MLTILGNVISLFLILIILVRIPRDSIGLSSFANSSDLLGSPGSAQRFLDILTVSGILIYFAIAFQLNIQMN